MGHDIAGHRPAVNHIHRMSRRRIQNPVPVSHIPDIADLRLTARLPESGRKLLKFIDAAVIHKIRDHHIRMLHPLLIGGVQIQKRPDPAVVQLKTFETVLFQHFLMHVVQRQRLVQHVILVHGAGAVGVDLAELEAPILFVEKNIKPGDGQEGVVQVGNQNQFLQFPGKGKNLPVPGISQVFPDHLFQDPVGGMYHLPEKGDLLFCKNFRNVERMHHQSVVGRRGVIQILLDGRPGIGAFLKMLLDIRLIFRSDLLHFFTLHNIVSNSSFLLSRQFRFHCSLLSSVP